MSSATNNQGESGIEIENNDSDGREEGILSPLIGHKGAKAILRKVLRKGEPHILLEGPPASGKSVALECIEKHVPGAKMEDGKGLTERGLRDLLAEDPPILLIDELDAANGDVYEALSMSMESGRVTKRTANEDVDVTINTQIIAACNDADSMFDHTDSRFRVLTFEGYSKGEFVRVCAKLLPREVDWVETESTGAKIGKVVCERLGTCDPREARDAAKLADSIEEVPDMCRALNDPSVDIESSPIQPSELYSRDGISIESSSLSPAKIKLMQRLPDSIMGKLTADEVDAILETWDEITEDDTVDSVDEAEANMVEIWSNESANEEDSIERTTMDEVSDDVPSGSGSQKPDSDGVADISKGDGSDGGAPASSMPGGDVGTGAEASGVGGGGMDFDGPPSEEDRADIIGYVGQFDAPVRIMEQGAPLEATGLGDNEVEIGVFKAGENRIAQAVEAELDDIDSSRAKVSGEFITTIQPGMTPEPVEVHYVDEDHQRPVTKGINNVFGKAFVRMEENDSPAPAFDIRRRFKMERDKLTQDEAQEVVDGQSMGPAWRIGKDSIGFEGLVDAIAQMDNSGVLITVPTRNVEDIRLR